MAKVKIAVIVSTTRAARFGHKPAQWIAAIASQRDDMVVEVVDLREYPMPFFDEVASNAWVPSQNEVAQRWQKKVGEFDGYIFVSAEYNRGVPAVLKNALDYAYPEWNNKPAAFVGYGSVGAARAIEQLRLIAIELQMADPDRCPYSRRRLHGGLEGRKGHRGPFLSPAERNRYARPTRLVDQCAQGGARTASGFRCRVGHVVNDHART
jgi:NAD(P)H-dependent FMN reductase